MYILNSESFKQRGGRKNLINYMNDNHTILHVDDDLPMIRFVADQLEKHGYQTDSLDNPAEVMKAVIQNKYRIILLDIDMPGKNGIELLQEVKAYDGGIQIIVLTGLTDMSTVLKSLRMGAEACFFKPVDDVQPLVDALDDTVRKINRWWRSLDDLRARRMSELEPANTETVKC